MKLIEARATCHNCEWNTSGLNATGNAAQHNYKTGHYVMVELTYLHAFKNPKKEKE